MSSSSGSGQVGLCRSSGSLDSSVDSTSSSLASPTSSPSRTSLQPRDVGRTSSPDGDAAAARSSPRQRLVTSANSDPRIKTQQFPDDLLSKFDLEVVYEVVDSASKTPDDGDGKP